MCEKLNGSSKYSSERAINKCTYNCNHKVDDLFVKLISSCTSKEKFNYKLESTNLNNDLVSLLKVLHSTYHNCC